MLKIPFSLIALSHSVDATLDISEERLEEVMQDFFSIFIVNIDLNGEKSINALQANTPEFRERIEGFIERYKGDDVKVHKLRGYCQGLKENENLFLRMREPLSFEQNLPLYNYLTSLRENKEYEIVKKENDYLFSQLHNTYEILSFGAHSKQSIGELNKSKRVCRFCKNTRVNLSFKNVAHAVSEALGNRAIILNEECDECNSEFGKGIERDLITFLKFDASFYGIKGKGGVSKIKGKNFSLSNENGKIELNYTGSKSDIKLVAPEPIVLQNVYKTLCKYVLSVIPSIYLDVFRETIQWIRTNEMEEQLPLVSILTSFRIFKEHPILNVYIQKAEKPELPFAVGELQFAYLTICFILPFATKGGTDFHLTENYEKYWNYFSHYNSLSWDFIDLSDSAVRPFAIKITFPENANQESDSLDKL